MNEKPYVWIPRTGTLLAVKECKVIYLTKREAEEVKDGALLPADVNEFDLSLGDECRLP